MLTITDDARRTGRTTKMLEAALDHVEKGKSVGIYTDRDAHASILCDQFVGLALMRGLRPKLEKRYAVEFKNAGKALFHTTTRIPGFHQGEDECFADHYATQRLVERITEALSKVHSVRHIDSGAVLQVLFEAADQIEGLLRMPEDPDEEAGEPEAPR